MNNKKNNVRDIKKNVYPKKKEERSTTETGETDEMDTEFPELAQSISSSEAHALIEAHIKPIKKEVFFTEITGNDLIVHNWSQKAITEMLRGQQMTKEEKRLAKEHRAPKNPKEEFEGSRYRFDGKDWFPSNGIKKSLVSAGFAMGIPRSVIQRCVFVRGTTRRDYVELKYARIVMREDPVRVGPWNKREADLRYRAEYQNWSAALEVTSRVDMISRDQVVMLLENAGFSVGIGEWRPEKSGQAGTFETRKANARKVA